MTKHILITGSNGQLGREMRNLLEGRKDCKSYFTDVAELDITSQDEVNRFFNSCQIDYLVNCAAYTAVDKAESERTLCKKLNADAVSTLAQVAHAHGAKMLHISTDYVFDGNSCLPYEEQMSTNPCSVYGTTKLEGERNLMQTAPDSIIIRTAWLYSPYGQNFVKTMLNLGRSKPELKVIYDQTGTPTYALDLAKAIMTAIDADKWHSGIYHFANEGAISWYDFAKAVHRIAGIESCIVTPCRTEDYPTVAARPHYSVLDKCKIKETFGITIPYWEDSLKACIDRLTKKN